MLSAPALWLEWWVYFKGPAVLSFSRHYCLFCCQSSRRANLNERSHPWIARTAAAVVAAQLLDHASPHNIDAERACWRAAPGSWPHRRSGRGLEPADFAGEANRTIYEAMLRLHSAGKPVDVTLLVGELREAESTTRSTAFRRQRWSSCFGCFQWCGTCRTTWNGSRKCQHGAGRWCRSCD